MLSLDEDIMLIEHLDWDHEIPCDQIAHCDNEAEWKFTVSCCGKMLFFCNSCFEDTMDAKRTCGITHNTCGTESIDILNPERFKVSA